MASRSLPRSSPSTSPRRKPQSANTRSIGSQGPAVGAKRCICSKVNTRGGLVSPTTRDRSPEPHPTDEVHLGHVIGDCILKDRREGARDVLGAGVGTPLDAEHMVDQVDGVPAFQLRERPVAQWDAAELDIEDLSDAAGQCTRSASAPPAEVVFVDRWADVDLERRS